MRFRPAETRVHPKFTDVDYVLKFGREKVLRSFLIIGLLSLAVGIFGASFDFVRETREVTSTDTLPVHLAAGGVQAIRFVPMDSPVR